MQSFIVMGAQLTSMSDTISESSKSGCWKLVEGVPLNLVPETWHIEVFIKIKVGPMSKQPSLNGFIQLYNIWKNNLK